MSSVVKKVMFVGRATVFMVGLAVVLALTVGVASTALAGTGVGATFNLGKTNTVNAISKLVGSVAGPSLQIDNNSTDAAATALDLQVEPGKAPMKVNSITQVQNLNADQVDGKSAGEFLGRFEAASNSNLLDGRDSTAFVGATRPMTVVAAGTVNGSGLVLEQTSNVTVQKSATGRYLIDISGIDNYIASDFVAVATAITDQRVARADSFSGNMLVETQDMAGTNADASFTFVVYDAGA